jgi:predicted dehydrogenase
VLADVPVIRNGSLVSTGGLDGRRHNRNGRARTNDQKGKTMRVAVIGRGFGKYAMAPAYTALGCEVDLVAARDAAAVEAACQSADLVSIHSPPFQHREHVLMALETGKPVLCDKPFGRDAAEAREMRDAARAAGVLHFLNYEFRCDPARAKARALIAEGAIGTLSHVSQTMFAAGLRGRPHGWLNDASLGGGWIGAYASHFIDGLRFYFGREVTDCGGLTRIETRERPDGDGRPVASTAEDSMSLWFTIAGGGSASLDTSFAATVNLPPVTYLVGSEGAIALGDNRLTLTTAAGSEDIDVSAESRGMSFAAVPLWLEKVLAAVRDGEQIAPNFDDGVAAAEVMERLRGAVVASL